MSEERPRPSRRALLRVAAVGSAVVGGAVHAWAWMRSLKPNVLYEPPRRRRLGSPEGFPEGHTFLAEHQVFLIRGPEGLRALSAVCTHLGCTVGRQGEGYHCPCHGSVFAADGKNVAGPAPRPLPWRPLSLGGGGVLVVDLGREVGPDVVLAVAPPAESR
jgi:menaquinol-cytochrome c reductase iron-sulfur subunit